MSQGSVQQQQQQQKTKATLSPSLSLTPPAATPPLKKAKVKAEKVPLHPCASSPPLPLLTPLTPTRPYSPPPFLTPPPLHPSTCPPCQRYRGWVRGGSG